MGIESWSTSAGSNNQAPPNGWPGGMLPSQVEPTARQMMASIATWYQAAQWINYNFTPVYISNTQFSVASMNVTSTYQVGRRVQATDGTTFIFGTVTASTFSTATTVTVAWDSGAVLQTGVTIVYVGIISPLQTSLPPLTSAAFANPSATIGLTAVNGTATTAMTSDSAPALSQSISPTWTGNHVFSNVVTISQSSNARAINPIQNSNTGTSAASEIALKNSTNAFSWNYLSTGWSGGFLTGSPTGEQGNLWTSAAFPIVFGTNSIARMVISATGNITVNAPSVGASCAVTGPVGNNALNIIGSSTTSQSFGQNISSGTNSSDYALTIFNQAVTTNLFKVRGDGLVQAVDQGGTLQDVGWRDIPQNLQTANYTTVLADRGKGIDMNGSSLTATIAANASVAYPVGTTLVFTNLNASNLSIAINSDTLTLAGTTTTGTRTLIQNGVATARKLAATSWIISGSGLS